MTHLTLHLLGPPSVAIDGQEIRISRRKALALLAYLAVTDQSHTRDALATLFWPEQDQSRARNSLRGALVTLRKALGEGWLEADRENVGLWSHPELVEGADPSTGSGRGFWLDVGEFQKQLVECQTHGHPPDEVCPGCIPLLAGAAELYRGDFMAGFTLPDSPAFDEWQYFQSESLRDDLAGALERLAYGHSAQGEFEPAIAHARRWVALDALNEPAHRVLMQLYAWSGQRAAAVAQYAACQRILAEELGAPPDEATTQLYQAIVDKTEQSPPTERIAIAPKHNLPAQRTSFVGREREIAEITRLLETSRLLTLTGPPGTGKTRLSLQVAAGVVDQYADGIFFVDLAPISDPRLVADVIAHVLGVRESGGQPPEEALKMYVRDSRLLLLLDNFEQIIDAAPLVGELLSAAPGLKALVTSREALCVYGEQEYPVPPLAVPDLEYVEPLSRLSQIEAVDLFAQRARAVRPDFRVTEGDAAAVAEICVRLDGLPLAIELAAARSKLLPPQLMRERLGNRLGDLTRGPRDLPARQRTLRGAIDWSCDLLDPEEKRLFARLAVFQGGRTVEAVQAVCGQGLSVDTLDGLESLLNKSLLRQDTGSGGEPRFVMLEMLHEYAREQLEESGETEEQQRRHAEYFLALAERAAPELRRTRQVYWFARLRDEHNNMRTALAWSLGRTAQADSELGLRLADALRDFWFFEGHSTEGLAWTTRALETSLDALPTLRGRALNAAGLMCYDRGDHEQGEVYNREALALLRDAGDKAGSAWALAFLSVHALASPGECEKGIALCEEALALFRGLDDTPGITQTLIALGELSRLDGDYERAGRAYEECLAIARRVGDKMSEAKALGNLGYVAQHRGEYVLAGDLITAALTRERELGARRYLFQSLAQLAGPVTARGNPEKAAQLLGASEALLETMGIGLQAGDWRDIERYVASAREQLDATTFECAWAKGRAMSLDEAVALALGEGAAR
jgi:predicted ATPase/DNA-binding SARP family transcriptional activator